MTRDVAPPRSTYKWSVVVLLSLGMMIAYIDRANLSIVLAAHEFRSIFHLTDADRGVLNSAFFWSYAILQLPAGWIIDRYGTKIPYAIGFALWTLVSAATGLAATMGQVIAARVVLGVGESVSTAASIRWIRSNCSEEQRGLATGILFSGTKVGAAAGAPIAVFLTARYSWRLMFIIIGLGGLLWLIAWLLTVKNDFHRTAPAPVTTAPSQSIAGILKTRTMCGILLGTFCYNYFIYFCLTWLPAYFVDARHLSLNSMGLFTMFSFGGMAIVAIFGGWLADWFITRGGHAVGVRKRFTILGFALASSEILGVVVHSPSVSIFFAIFSLTGIGLATANYWAITQTLIPRAAIGRIAGVQNFASNLSGLIAALLTGWLKQATGGYTASMLTVLFVLLLGIFSYGFLVKSERQLQPARDTVKI